MQQPATFGARVLALVFGLCIRLTIGKKHQALHLDLGLCILQSARLQGICIQTDIDYACHNLQ